jgi:protein dithiol oxidoreductase (disulfide-forming)
VNRRDFSAQTFINGLDAIGLSITGLSLPGRASAQGGVPVEGTQFTRIEPAVPPQTAGKLDVLEFFSYACPHCAAFEPALEAWTKKLPADVSFQRVPVPFLANAENLQRTYYALQTLGQVEAVQRKVFAAIHVDRLHLDKPADIAALMAKNGIDAAKFLDVFNSFSVANSVSKAKKLSAAYRIDSVPALAVQGRYITSPSQAGGSEGALAVADFLVQRARKG